MSVIKHRPTRAKVTIICTEMTRFFLFAGRVPNGSFQTVCLRGEAPTVAAARELWKALSLHCSGLHLVGIIEIGNVLHHIFTTDFADGCSVALGRHCLV